MKITKKHFDFFKRRCLFWRDFFKLNHWNLEFFIDKKGGDFFAGGKHFDCHSIIRINHDWSNHEYKKLNEESLDDTARHEILHIFFHIKEEEAVTRLTNLFKFVQEKHAPKP